MAVLSIPNEPEGGAISLLPYALGRAFSALAKTRKVSQKRAIINAWQR